MTSSSANEIETSQQATARPAFGGNDKHALVLLVAGGLAAHALLAVLGLWRDFAWPAIGLSFILLVLIGERAGRSCTSPSFARIRIASRRGVRLTPSSAAWSRSLTAVPGGSTPRRMSRRSRVAICSGRVSSVMAQFTSLNPHLFSTRKGGLP